MSQNCLTPNQGLQFLYIHIFPCGGCFSIHPFLFSLPQFSLTNAFGIIPPILIITFFHIIHLYHNISTASISIVKADTDFSKYIGKWFYIGYTGEIYDLFSDYNVSSSSPLQFDRQDNPVMNKLIVLGLELLLIDGARVFSNT